MKQLMRIAMRDEADEGRRLSTLMMRRACVSRRWLERITSAFELCIIGVTDPYQSLLMIC